MIDGVLKHDGWPGRDGVEHGFTTRTVYDRGDGIAKLTTWPGLTSFQAVRVRQVHGRGVVHADRADGVVHEGDALISAARGILLTIATADCLPVLLYSAGPPEVVAAIHCGWKGLRARVIDATLEEMKRQFGVEASQVTACFGPSIEGECYEVGPELQVPFAARSITSSDGRLHLNLALEALVQIQAAGVPESAVIGASPCTMCDPVRFFSYRRDGPATGRMINFIGLSPDRTS